MSSAVDQVCECAVGRHPALREVDPWKFMNRTVLVGRALHSSTFQLNLSRF